MKKDQKIEISKIMALMTDDQQVRLGQAAELYFFQYRNPANVHSIDLPGVTQIDKHFLAGAAWIKADEAKRACGLVEALKFYANTLNWQQAWREDLKDYVPANSDGTSIIERDLGKAATEALRAYEANPK